MVPAARIGPSCSRTLAERPGSSRLQANLAAAPMAAELVVADRGAGLHAEPLRQRPVHVKLFREVFLQLEGLVGAHRENTP